MACLFAHFGWYVSHLTSLRTAVVGVHVCTSLVKYQKPFRFFFWYNFKLSKPSSRRVRSESDLAKLIVDEYNMSEKKHSFIHHFFEDT